jgi:hypothetical protein
MINPTITIKRRTNKTVITIAVVLEEFLSPFPPSVFLSSLFIINNREEEEEEK